LYQFRDSKPVFMYILIDKTDKICYPCEDLSGVSDSSGRSVDTLRSWVRKSSWYENDRWVLIKEKVIKGKRGGLNEGNRHLFK